MSDDDCPFEITTDCPPELTDTIYATGDVCAPMSSPYLEDPPPFLMPLRPVSASLTTFSAIRGTIRFAPPAPRGWGPPAPVPLQARLGRRVHRFRCALGVRLHDLARWVGNEPEPEDWWS